MLQMINWGLARAWRPTVRYSSTIQLRDYQQHVIDLCMNRILSNRGTRARFGVSLATGGGKTVIFTNLIKQLGEQHRFARTLVLAHRRELVNQAAGTIRKFIPNSNVQIEMGKFVASLGDDSHELQVVIASVQSLIRRLENYQPNAFDLIIIDEAHHAVAKSYLQILQHFKQDVPVVGFSATFERADKKALETVIDEIVYHRGILDMIEDKWLCDAKFTAVSVNCDLSGVETSSNTQDFMLDSLSQVMNRKEVNEMVFQSYQHKSAQNDGFNSTLLFAVDIEHVKTLYQLFKDHGINANYVTANTPADKRDQIVTDFKNGKVEVLMNCGIFTEGTDMPNIDCILLCRPTRSRSLMVQMIGRGLRLHHSKDFCHIIDFVGASNVGVVSVPTLAGIKHFDGNLENATMQELQMIKEDIASRQMEERKKEEIQREGFHDWMKDVTSFDLTLSTFDSFENYYKRQQEHSNSPMNEPLDDKTYFSSSVYPWVKFAQNAWALSLHNGHHLRLYKQKSKDKSFEYTLNLYREIPHYLRDEVGPKFVKRELIKDKDFTKIPGKVEEVIENLSKPKDDEPVKNFTKFARWRKEPATARQRTVVSQRLKSRLRNDKKSYALVSQDLASFIGKISKGEAAKILFATSLAPAYPIDSLLKVLDYRKRSNL